MNVYYDVIINHTAYLIIIICSLAVGSAAYIIGRRRKHDFLEKLIFFISGGLSIITSLAICMGVSKIFSTEKLTYRSVFSIFYAFSSFPVFMFILKKAAGRVVSFKECITPLILTIMLGRIGCIVENCCMGKIYAAYIEIAIMAALLIYNIIKKNLKFHIVCLIYFIWRFIAEFFKETFTIEKIGIFSLLQYVAVLGILTIIIYITLPKRRTENEKQ